jgi:hypothetical protein
MMNSEVSPLMINLFDSDLVQRIVKEGRVYIRKAQPVLAEQIIEKQKVVTVIPDGGVESIVEANPADWIITGSKGERFVVTNDKFKSLYNTNAENEYVPRAYKIIALRNPFNKSIRIVAPWSSPEHLSHQYGNEEAILVLTIDECGTITDNRYLIGDQEMLVSNYELLGSFQGLAI